MTSIELDYSFQAMKAKDLPHVLENEKRGYTHPWTEGIFLDCIRSKYECWLVIFEGSVVGHGILSTLADEAHLLNVCIHPVYQRKGLGRLLVEFMLGKARENTARTVFLEVRLSNRAAYQLYMSMGFNEVGIRKGYYPAFIGREDAIVLACELLD